MIFTHHALNRTNSRPGRYSTLLSTIPWTETEANSLINAKVTVYCGDANFVAFDTDDATGSKWMDLTTAYVFYGPSHSGNANANFCGSGAIAQTLNHGHISNPTANPTESDIQVLILCDAALVRGAATQTTQSRGTLQEIYNAGELAVGRSITDIGYQHTLSWTVLHELFHAALTNISKLDHFMSTRSQANYCPFRLQCSRAPLKSMAGTSARRRVLWLP